MVTVELIAAARAGNADAFGELTQPHRRELQVYCYRMLGSLHDAEDALQETLLSAWQGFAAFEGRASLRTWLYRIATNRCLNMRRSAGRRQAKEWEVAGVQPPDPTRLGEVVWLEPIPDPALGDISSMPLGPEARFERTESISLAFITALQLLPPRQLAVLVLRDVLGFHASEVAAMVDSSIEAVNSALKRARTGLQRSDLMGAGREAAPAVGSPAEQALVAEFVRAYESADLPALIALLTRDVVMSMPPMPQEYEGLDAVAGFCALIFRPGRDYTLVPTRANGQPAFGLYVATPSGVHHGTGLVVITICGTKISSLTRFESGVLPSFGLPRTLPSGPARD